MIYCDDALEFTFNVFLKIFVISGFNLKFKREIKAFISEIRESCQNLRAKVSVFNFNFYNSDSSKITSELDSNSGS